MTPDVRHTAERRPRAASLRALIPLALLLVGSGGCLEAPKIEDRWTRVDLDHSSLAPGQALTAGTMDSIHVDARITYRRIVTGFFVAELRASATLGPSNVALNPDAPRVPMANDVDAVLANSVSIGRAVYPVTGWDHLIQPVSLDFRAMPQATVDSSGVSLGATSGLFLVCYLGSGVKIERRGQADSIAVTPFLSAPNQLLPVGMELTVTP